MSHQLFRIENAIAANRDIVENLKIVGIGHPHVTVVGRDRNQKFGIDPSRRLDIGRSLKRGERVKIENAVHRGVDLHLEPENEALVELEIDMDQG